MIPKDMTPGIMAFGQPDSGGGSGKQAVESKKRFHAGNCCSNTFPIDSPRLLLYHLTMGVPKMQETYTYEQYLTWSNEERWELIHGVPYNMSPAPSRRHQGIVQELSGQFYNFLLDKPCQAYPAPFDVRFPNTEGIIDTVVQPDLSVICDITKLDDQGCLGAPDLIVEILSPATASKDLKEKLTLYETHGVKEYWVVDPHDKVIFLFIFNKDKLYDKPRIFSSPDRIESVVLKGLVIDSERIFNVDNPDNQ